MRLTTYHLHVPIVKKSEGLNLLEPCGSVQVCKGTALPLAFACEEFTLLQQSGRTQWPRL